MFDISYQNKDAPPTPQLITHLPPAATAPRASLSIPSRRSSTQAQSPAEERFLSEGDGGGEESMEIETESEASDSDSEGIEMGRRFDVAFTQTEDDADAEGEEDLDETQIIYGGIVPQQMPTQEESFSGDVSVQSAGTAEGDDEKTMDFTIAIGGLIPRSAPEGAKSDRNSIGYTFGEHENAARLIPGESVEGELSMEMDETIAFGGIIGADESISSGSDENTMNGRERERTMTFSFGDLRPRQSVSATMTVAEDDGGMEMTLAMGGILQSSTSSSVASRPPTPGRPSFARPTVSSAQKNANTSSDASAGGKRNVFAPSPSPYKSNTPSKHINGLSAASDVAKRLSFGSTTSSGGGKKRTLEHSPESQSPRKRPALADSVFGTNAATSTPSKRVQLNSTTPAKSPSMRSPFRKAITETTNLPTSTEHEEGEGGEDQEWQQPPTIRLADFLEMTGVGFIDLPGMGLGLGRSRGLGGRRSSVGKGLLGGSHSGGRSFVLLSVRGKKRLHDERWR